MVARDDQGVVLQCQYTSVDGAFSPHLAEPWTQVILESDASNVINSINLINQFDDYDSVISSIRVMGSKFASFQALYCGRTANQVAHRLASKGLHSSFYFDNCCLWFISKYVLPAFIQH